MKKGYSIILGMFILLINSCIDPLELDIDASTGQLVVDGTITNEPGTYSVRLSRSKPYISYADSWDAVETGATVIIADDKGTEETLSEVEPGLYQTSAGGIQGEVGNTYTLRIRTKDGKQYNSAPEKLLPVPEVESLYYVVRPQQVLNDDDMEQTIHVVDVFVNAQDPAAEKNYYMWQWEGTFKVSTQPWDYSEKVRGVRVPMPKDCCETCWMTNFTNSVNVKDDRLINGKKLKRHLVTQIPVIAQAFGSKYYLVVKQTSISEEAFDYWQLLKSQIENGGGIQDPPPAIVIGNITNVNNPEERALGFFGASAVATKTLFIKREDLGVQVGEYVLSDDCRVLLNSTTEQPSFW